MMFKVKCADCGCAPRECMKSPSAIDCPNCILAECCCWFQFPRTEEVRLTKKCVRCGKDFENYCIPCNDESENKFWV